VLDAGQGLRVGLGLATHLFRSSSSLFVHPLAHRLELVRRRGIAAARLVSASIEISTPGPMMPPM